MSARPAGALCSVLLAGVATLALAQPAAAQPARALKPADPGPAQVDQVVVTASRLDLIGVAATASQGAVTQQELSLRPVYRVGQLLEATPGLVVTAHSGEGKANQYLIRGFNLDHGTDIANFVDGMPVNRPTNTHGQGYSDMNFVIPQVTQGLDYTKGPYYAAVGDFGAVASTHLKLADDIPDQVSLSAGGLAVYNGFVGGTVRFSDTDRLLGGLYLGHVDGPFDHPDDFRKVAGTLRYSHGTPNDGYSLTAMYYKGDGNFTTDQPLRAVQSGLIGRFGTLDPTDGNRSERMSLSGQYGATGDHWSFNAGAYAIHSRMTLWNDFTHFLDDPINGDQEQQTESRDTFGGQAAFSYRLDLGGVQSDTVVGLQARFDNAFVDHRHTLDRAVLPYCSIEQADGPAIQQPFANGVCNADRVHLADIGPYVENTTHWTPWLRTILGVREEYYHATDQSLIIGFDGSAHQYLFQPKASLVVGPFAKTELYFSAGRGFHSDDVRGVFGTVPLEGVATGPTPLLAPATGYEIGLREDILRHLALQVALFQEDFNSELTYNADVGQDEASAPSRRQGVEISAQYRPFPWIELNTDLAFSKARYRSGYQGFGLDGPYIANAPGFIGSFGALVDNLGPWFGGLEWRILGAYPLGDGDKEPQDKGYREVNIDAGYKVSPHLKVQASIYNLFNSKANAAAYYYTSRLPGEPLEGVSDFQVHPLEPITAVFNVTATF